MNEIVEKRLLAGDKRMSVIPSRRAKYTCSGGYGQFTKNKKRVEKFQEVEDLQKNIYIYKIFKYIT